MDPIMIEQLRSALWARLTHALWGSPRWVHRAIARVTGYRIAARMSDIQIAPESHARVTVITWVKLR